jgi:SAM-dependent methyltransferase
MESKIYSNEKYIENNPLYHVSDSLWKAKHILQMLKKHQLEIHSVCEVGCGAGEILRQLQLNLPNEVEFTGYDINPYAIELSKQRVNSKLSFCCEDILLKNTELFDLLLCIDVFEHVDNYLGFLQRLRHKAKFKIFHIPLDISVQTVLRRKPITDFRTRLGHLHYFTKETALSTLSDTGYEIIDYFYTSAALEFEKTLTVKLAKFPIKIMSMINQDLSERIFGAYALLVLAN